MSALADVVEAIREALTQAGIPTADGPSMVGVLIARDGCVALIQPPEVASRVLGKPMTTETDVHLLAAPPGDANQYLKLWEHLPAALDALHAAEARVAPHEVAGITYPGYLIRTTNRAT